MNESAPKTQACDPATNDSAQLARRALFGFILTFIAARTVVLLSCRTGCRIYISFCAERTSTI